LLPTPDPPSLRFGGQDPSPPLAALAGGGEKNDAPSSLPLSAGGEKNSAPDDLPPAGGDADGSAACAAGEKKKRVPWRKYEFDDDLMEELRRRYEETDETVVSIARWRGVSNTHLHRIAKDNGWVKFKPGPMGLSPAAKLNARAEALLKARVEDGPPPLTREQLRGLTETLLREAEAHAAELETLHKQSTAAGLRPRDAHLITANIADMTATLAKLGRLCAPEPQRTSTDDDQPQDTDAVRDELARRIDALVDEWLHAAAADGASGDQGKA
jgi:hypothetical protein